MRMYVIYKLVFVLLKQNAALSAAIQFSKMEVCSVNFAKQYKTPRRYEISEVVRSSNSLVLDKNNM